MELPASCEMNMLSIAFGEHWGQKGTHCCVFGSLISSCTRGAYGTHRFRNNAEELDDHRNMAEDRHVPVQKEQERWQREFALPISLHLLWDRQDEVIVEQRCGKALRVSARLRCTHMRARGLTECNGRQYPIRVVGLDTAWLKRESSDVLRRLQKDSHNFPGDDGAHGALLPVEATK